MTEDEFWTLIEQARTDASKGNGVFPAGSAIGSALADRLERLPPERIVEFQHRFYRVTARADQWGLCASALLIWDRVSDDGFSDFKAGLVGLGRDAFERVVADPDALADHPMVRAIAAGQVDGYALAGEAIGSAASEAYDRGTDDPDEFWEALEDVQDTGDEDTPGEPWSGRFGGPDDTARIPLRLPRLHALFVPAEDGDR